MVIAVALISLSAYCDRNFLINSDRHLAIKIWSMPNVARTKLSEVMEQSRMEKNGAALLLQSHPANMTAGAGSFKIFLLLSLVTLLPTSVFYVFATSSQAAGVASAALVVLGLAALGITRSPETHQVLAALTTIVLISIGILSHALIAYYFQPLDFLRMVQSLFLFALMMVGSYFLRFAVFDNEFRVIDIAATGVFLTFVLIGIAAILGIRPIESVTSFNPVFPFTEPSHYALTFTPILLFMCARHIIVVRVLALLSALTIAYLLESLSLVVGVTLVGLVTLPIPYLAIAAAGLTIAIGILDITYFTDRLDLSYDSGNLSVLVYLQGWELATGSVYRTLGWGIGFQQLGFGPINSPTADIILRLAGTDSNLKDGGFTLAKATSEFGVFGFAGILLFGVMALRTAWIVRMIALGRKSATIPSILAMSVVCGYAIEAFVRGIGYFSGSTMLLLASVLYMNAVKMSDIATTLKH